MDFNQVRYFLALADTLNFTRAAERCNVSQPALTQGIKRLEVELGGALVRRDGRFTELTELGRGLRTHFEQINRTRHLVRTTAKAIVDGEVAELNVGLMCTVGPSLLAGMLNDFRLNHPMVSVVLHDVTPNGFPDLLLTGGLDAVFCALRGPAHERLRYVNLYDEPMVAAFKRGHPLESCVQVPLKEVLSQPYVDRLHCEFRQEAYDYAKAVDIEMNVVFQSEREDWIQSLVQTGAGVSIIPRYSLLQSQLEYRPIVDPMPMRSVVLAVVSDEQASPALEKLVTESVAYHWPSVKQE